MSASSARRGHSKSFERLKFEAQRAFTVIEKQLLDLKITEHPSFSGGAAFILHGKLIVSPERFAKKPGERLNIHAMTTEESCWLRTLQVIDCEQ